ncbi:hypothetical protein Salat_2624800 [Sesamum alatum]|uniref:Uncharacterized protein n=1 Tax=Sesamum alatum TaxID=300844 RepID=A0AAE2CAQ2_9LAMI|nr:hypothetical protein Salat_2624800 [Sesamum alatum]
MGNTSRRSHIVETGSRISVEPASPSATTTLFPLGPKPSGRDTQTPTQLKPLCGHKLKTDDARHLFSEKEHQPGTIFLGWTITEFTELSSAVRARPYKPNLRLDTLQIVLLWSNSLADSSPHYAQLAPVVPASYSHFGPLPGHHWTCPKPTVNSTGTELLINLNAIESEDSDPSEDTLMPPPVVHTSPRPATSFRPQAASKKRLRKVLDWMDD